MSIPLFLFSSFHSLSFIFLFPSSLNPAFHLSFPPFNFLRSFLFSSCTSFACSFPSFLSFSLQFFLLFIYSSSFLTPYRPFILLSLSLSFSLPLFLSFPAFLPLFFILSSLFPLFSFCILPFFLPPRLSFLLPYFVSPLTLCFPNFPTLVLSYLFSFLTPYWPFIFLSFLSFLSFFVSFFLLPSVLSPCFPSFFFFLLPFSPSAFLPSP